MFASTIFSSLGSRLKLMSDKKTNSSTATTLKSKFKAVSPVFFIVIVAVFAAPNINCSFIELVLMLKSFILGFSVGVTFTITPPPPQPPPPPVVPPPLGAGSSLGQAELLHKLLQQNPPSH